MVGKRARARGEWERAVLRGFVWCDDDDGGGGDGGGDGDGGGEEPTDADALVSLDEPAREEHGHTSHSQAAQATTLSLASCRNCQSATIVVGVRHGVVVWSWSSRRPGHDRTNTPHRRSPSRHPRVIGDASRGFTPSGTAGDAWRTIARSERELARTGSQSRSCEKIHAKAKLMEKISHARIGCPSAESTRKE